MNKTISTPIAIIIVIVLACLAAGGIFVYQYYWQTLEKETETPTDENIDFNNIAKSFCESKESVAKYSSLINFDQDKYKEIILMCTTFDYSDSFDWEKYPYAVLDLYVLNKENGNYQNVWEKNTEKDFNFRVVSKPEIINLDEDGIDEILISGGNWGGTCTGSFSYYFLYSPKHNELFLGIHGRGAKGYVGLPRSESFIIFEGIDDNWPCPESDKGIEVVYLSNNLKEPEYQIFRTYLEGLLWERINEVSVEK